MLVDTHCHIHESSYPLDSAEVLSRLESAGVSAYVCVGTSLESSREAVDFCARHDRAFASVGVHPHDTKDGYDIEELARQPGVIAIGEIGLDYYYTHSPKQTQLAALRAQLDVAVKYDLPVIFHVREAFDDFWPVFDSYEGKIRGVLHSFTDTKDNLQKALDRGLYIGVNGISTFTKDEAQRQMFDAIPLDRLLFETDAPFLTPHPFRGKVNEPALVRNVAEYHAQRRQLSLEAIALQTTKNAQALLRF
ncbi:preprotein translocase [Candidatus Saccharibacteria bacterium]|nr:preprotein translocase [Candidatus Saccharibacteria bacterium]MAU34034.1 preprotein translocase [Candidatus Saccharibacteria bacterium]MBJ58785.1 preprotein translocase [Candidatus Saccharibacteria bacterium]MBQ69584.1 preprotein translocase [Candidatus Saccharibacteria bacterium]|tara:strand:+ start:1770 stop:2516 length:747 start_codon:yes stop_codon:yes gene_type:complete